MGKQKHFRTGEQVEFADLLKASGLKQAEVARRIGLTRGSISRILSGDQNPSAMAVMALRRLVAEMKSPTPPESGYELHEAAPALRRIPILSAQGESWKKERGELRWVPVVSFARAGADGFDYEDLGTHFDDWVPTDSRDKNAFALIVESDSMEPRYNAGDILVVSPNEEARNGDLVVARLEKSGGVLFKLFHRVGPDKIRLTSYNGELYPPLEYSGKDFRFIYPIVNVLDRTRGR